MCRISRKSATRLGAALVAAAVLATGAQATTLVGYFAGNDPFGGHEKGLYGKFNGVEISSPSLAKCDVLQLSCNWENGAIADEDYTSAFAVTFNDDKSGNWSFTSDPSLTHAPSYMVVKAATTWALYSLDGALSGTWSTAGILNNGGKQPGVSHVSFYNSAAPIPLPAAAWLLLTGVGALGVVRRRRRAAA